MLSKKEKTAISNKFASAAKRAKERGFLASEQMERGVSVLHVFNKGACVLIASLLDDGRSFSRFYNTKGVCIRTLTLSPAGAVEQIGKVY